MKLILHDFYSRKAFVVASELIGCGLTFTSNKAHFTGRIVETEAYLGAEDPASHAYGGETQRNQVMFGPAGKTYVYFTYGNHYCLNVVTDQDQTAGAVLIRALEPVSGISEMQKNRKTKIKQALTSGPGKLTQAFGIDLKHSRQDLVSGPIRIYQENSQEPVMIQAATRIGISKAQDRLYRFYLKDSVYLSRTFSHEVDLKHDI